MSINNLFKKKHLFNHLLTTALLIGFIPAIAQVRTIQERKNLHYEEQDDPYIPVDRSNMERSPAYQFTGPNYFTRQVNVDANGNNIVGDAANEPSLAVDPTQPDRMVMGWRQFDVISSNFRQAGYGYSLNGGVSWTFPGVINPGVFRSDPVLDFDAEGNFYYNSLRGTFDCDVYKIENGGVVWGPPAAAKGGDKQWMRIDRTGGFGDKHNYSFWNSSFSTCNGNFTRSTDNSNTFEDCILVAGDPFWGTLAVDANGILYVTGMSNFGMIVARSFNAQQAGAPVFFNDFDVVDLDGELDGGPPINPQGLWGQAWVDVDISNGPGAGNVYVLASVNRTSVSDPADVMFARSTDGGETFSPPQRINDDIGVSFQWFGTMAVAPNGRIDVVWLDTRNAPAGTVDSVLYYTFSEDQGITWAPNSIISEPFDPTIGYPQQDKMGDYFDMVSDNDYAHVSWTATFTGGQDVYYTKISPSGTLAVQEYTVPANFVIAPNPLINEVTIRFSTQESVHAIMDVVDITGRPVNRLLDGEVSGLNSLTWNGTNSEGIKVSSGIYFVILRYNNQQLVRRVIVK